MRHESAVGLASTFHRWARRVAHSNEQALAKLQLRNQVRSVVPVWHAENELQMVDFRATQVLLHDQTGKVRIWIGSASTRPPRSGVISGAWRHMQDRSAAHCPPKWRISRLLPDSHRGEDNFWRQRCAALIVSMTERG